jgi:OOP family OmpA-OmpF porin
MSDDEKGPDTRETEETLERLRELLVGPEREDIDELRGEFEARELTADELSGVLPSALHAADEGQLTQVLAPLVESSIEVSVRKNPKPLTEAIFPLIGPAIRRSIRHSLAELTESLNRTLEYSFSARGLKWRLEAWRTGVPFAEVVLSHSLKFRVEQVFLIHRETGLLLEHVAASGVEAADPEMVSAMLTALGDFVADSFEEGETTTLSQIEFGGRLLEVAAGPHALIACDVRGVLDPGLRTAIEETVELLHAELAGPLQDFAGDTEPFFVTRSSLEALLIEEEPKSKKKSGVGQWVLALLLLAVFFFGTRAAISSWSAGRRWDELEAALRASPGIVLVHAERSGDHVELEGLRDPLAADPLKLARDVGYAPENIEASWTPFVSLEPELVRRRTLDSLALGADVHASWDGLKLTLEGKASSAWTLAVIERFQLGVFPGLEALDTTKLVDPNPGTGPH